MLDGPISRTDTPNPPERAGMVFRAPTAKDGAAVWRLVASCPPLDRNSLYCNLLQCADFSDTCLLAERHGRPVGWVSGYLPPDRPRTLFIWQVAVLPEARGLRLARSLILGLLDRPSCEAVDHVEATITAENEASWSLFASIADQLAAPFDHRVRFDGETHFAGQHDSEHLVTIGPIPKGGRPSDDPVTALRSTTKRNP